MRANCCAWKYTPVEIHCLRITFGIRMVRFFAHFYLLVARNKYASNMAAYAQLNGITAPHVYLVIRQCSFVFSVKKWEKTARLDRSTVITDFGLGRRVFMTWTVSKIACMVSKLFFKCRYILSGSGATCRDDTLDLLRLNLVWKTVWTRWNTIEQLSWRTRTKRCVWLFSLQQTTVGCFTKFA